MRRGMNVTALEITSALNFLMSSLSAAEQQDVGES